MPGPAPHPVHVRHGPEVPQRRVQPVRRADGGRPADDRHVGVSRAVRDRLGEPVGLVADHPRTEEVRSPGGQQRGQHRADRVPDPAPRGTAGVDHLVAADQQAGPGPGPDCEVVEADARGQPQHRRRDRRTRRHQFLTAGGVLARAPDVPTVARHRPQDVTDPVGDLVGHDPVRPARDGSAGGHLYGGPLDQGRDGVGATGQDSADHPPRARTAHRVSVHRGVVEPGQRDRRDQWRREGPAGGGGQRYRLRGQGSGEPVGQRPRRGPLRRGSGRMVTVGVVRCGGHRRERVRPPRGVGSRGGPSHPGRVGRSPGRSSRLR